MRKKTNALTSGILCEFIAKNYKLSFDTGQQIEKKKQDYLKAKVNLNEFKTFEKYVECKEKLFNELKNELKNNVARSQLEALFVQFSVNQTNLIMEKIKVTEEQKKLADSQEDLKKSNLAKQNMEEQYKALNQNFEQQKTNLAEQKTFLEKQNKETQAEETKKHQKEMADLQKKN